MPLNGVTGKNQDWVGSKSSKVKSGNSTSHRMIFPNQNEYFLQQIQLIQGEHYLVNLQNVLLSCCPELSFDV